MNNQVSQKEGRVPPQAVEVEEAVLGSMLIEAEAAYTAMEMLTAKDFYKNAHQYIYSAIIELSDQNTSFDLLAVENLLRDKGLLKTCGGPGYLSELTRYVSSAANVDYHAQILSEKAARRNLIKECTDIISQAYDSSSDTYDVLDSAAQKVFDLIHIEDQNNTQEAHTYIAEAFQHLRNIQGAPDGVTGVGTGLDVDKITAGWQNGDFIVIAARPSMGKTAFVLQSMKHAAREYGSAGLISLEMAGRSLGTRLLISEAGIDGQRARTGKLNENELSRVEEAAEKLHDLGLTIDDTTYVSASKLRAKARAMIHKYDIKVLAIDYVQLLTSDQDVREQQVAEISRTCKAIAKEYNIPVIGLSQLNRGCEARPGMDKRPRLSDLRESGAIEQDADVVGFLFRPEYYGITKYPEIDSLGNWAGKPTENICEVIIGKQRNGPTGMKRQGYNNKTMRFYNMAPDNGMREAMRRAKEQKENHAPF